MEKIFLAFGGRKDQNEDIEKIIIKNNLILLNLEKISIEELNSYLIEQEIALPYKHIVNEINYDNNTIPSWGIIYELEEDRNYNFLFLLELYLNSFLTPLFKFHKLGFEKLNYHYIDTFNDGHLCEIDIEKLYVFLNSFKGIIDYSFWLRTTTYEWVKNKDIESFRLHTSIGLYILLKEYNQSKSNYFWKKEVMEIGIILETLFTKPEEKESIGYVLKKRIHFLTIDFIENIEEKIKETYDTRSNFVHGSFFSELIKKYEIVGKSGDEDIKEIITDKMFEKTKEYITILRKILILYYKVFEGIKNGEYDSYFPNGKRISVIDIIELSMFNLEIRNKLINNIKIVKDLILF